MSATLTPLETIALTRLHQVSTPAGTSTPAVIAAICAELAAAGVKLTNPQLITDGFAVKVRPLVAEVRQLRGELGQYSPLFAGFPDKLPAFDDWQARRTLAAVRLISMVGAEDFAGGQFSDDQLREAMDFSAFGWWPASSVPQDVTQAEVDRAVQDLLPGDDRVTWMELTLVTAAELTDNLRAWMVEAFATPTSLREDVREQLALLVKEFGVAHIDPATVTFRETRTLLLAALWTSHVAAVATSGATPDDLLRLFAQLTGGDVSLTEKVTYPRMTRPQRRAVLAALEASAATGRLPEVFRHRGLWLAIAAGLHVGAEGGPAVQETFARLRATKHDAASVLSRTERALARGDYAAAVTELAAKAPTVLLRQLRRLASLADSDQHKIEALAEALEAGGDRVPLRVLHAALAQVRDNGATYPRVAITKRGKVLPVTRARGHLRVADDVREELIETLQTLICARQRAKGDLSGITVHIDPALAQVLMPEALRSTATGLVQAERGTRLPLGEGAVARMFVHWREPVGQTSDLDLSAVALDEDFTYLTHVSYTRLADGAMTHSGDLTSAPQGAQEFIDLRLADARARGWRYLVPTVYRFSGPSFDELPEAWVGWMLREHVSSDRRTFDAATVVNAFPLTGRAGTAAPILIDTLTGEVLYVDVYRPSLQFANVERDGVGVTAFVQAINDRVKLKPTVAEVARTAVEARGARLVEDPAQALITFGLDDACTYNALAPESLLAELYGDAPAT